MSLLHLLPWQEDSLPLSHQGSPILYIIMPLTLALSQKLCLLHLLFWQADSLPQASLVAQLVKNPPAMWETWVQSLGWEDALEKGIATNSSILA